MTAPLDFTELRELLFEHVECNGHYPDPEHDPPGRTVYCDGSCRHTPSALNRHAKALAAVLEMARRDWAVRVLDAHQVHDGRAYVTVTAPFQFETKEWGHKFAPGRYSTPGAARHAAALAVWPDLTDAARSSLGECP